MKQSMSEVSPPSGVKRHGADISAAEVARVLLEARYLVASIVGTAAILAVVWLLLVPPLYTARGSFIPTSGTQPSRLASIAGQFGFDVPTSMQGRTPEFYAELAGSRAILSELVGREYAVEAKDGSETVQYLPDLLDVAPDEPERVRDILTVDFLMEQAVRTRAGLETGIVTVEVTTPYPGLSCQVAEQIIALVNAFNLNSRQSQAAAERAFAERRVDEAHTDLRETEDRLIGFLQNNRDISAPELSAQFDRLQRDIAMKQQVYTSLVQAYEQARITEVRNTPVITPVDPPDVPVRPDPRGRVLKLLFVLVVSALLAVGIAFSRDYLRESREGGESGFAELEEEWSQTKSELRKLLPSRRNS